MRGLDDLELLFMDRAVRRADGEALPLMEPCVTYEPKFDGLVARGLGTRLVVGGCSFLAPTPLGRIALRIERLIRSGSALTRAA